MRKGFVALRVGGEGEEKRRFFVPVEYVNHPLFAGLLKEAEEEYGFVQEGPIAIPCHVEVFRYVREIIYRDSTGGGDRHRRHALHIPNCFKS
ncbi:hypothetical protein KSP40_PGU012595 [Platanthera guangdongensis]|uniref:Small auxin up regulated protein n=1 Tax=Platanthera guangdongensis TaxID=2320717 RepID=A0ABR2MLT9_9ASPA